jgi:RNA polymerase sigma-70 factor (ECF subfamily)
VSNPTGNNPADRNLVDRVLRGDTRAFGIIIKNTECLVAGIVFKLIPVAEERKDMAQDIYLKAFHNLAGFKFQSKLSTWIARIAYNSCLSWIEKKKLILPGNLQDEDAYSLSTDSVHPRYVASSDSERQLFQKELSVILNKEINGLPPLYQTLISLYHQQSMSYEELSQITGLPDGTVKSYLFRARKMLKENLLSKYKKEAL